jgi:hypothetical protein
MNQRRARSVNSWIWGVQAQLLQESEVCTSKISYLMNQWHAGSAASWIRGMWDQSFQESEACTSKISYLMNQRRAGSAASWIRGMWDQSLHESEACEISYFKNQKHVWVRSVTWWIRFVRSATSWIRGMSDQSLHESEACKISYFKNQRHVRVKSVIWWIRDVRGQLLHESEACEISDFISSWRAGAMSWQISGVLHRGLEVSVVRRMGVLRDHTCTGRAEVVCTIRDIIPCAINIINGWFLVYATKSGEIGDLISCLHLWLNTIIVTHTLLSPNYVLIKFLNHNFVTILLFSPGVLLFQLIKSLTCCIRITRLFYICIIYS